MVHAFECGLGHKWFLRVWNRAARSDMVRQKNEPVNLHSKVKINLCIEIWITKSIVHVSEYMFIYIAGRVNAS